ncbi:MAG: DUF4097 family beta strand repeat protein, partial [Blautia sp.]|nr:DUF4097 family beta strand repeat protein [Blautia sp.]
MKKETKFFLILAILLLVVGSGLAIAGAVLGADFSIFTEDVLEESTEVRGFMRFLRRHGILVITDEKDEDETEEPADESAGLSEGEIYADSIFNLDLDLKADELILRSWEKDMIQLKYDGTDSGKGKLSVSDGTLKFTGMRITHDREVVLYYPEGKTFDRVKIKVDAGEVEAESDLRASKLEVSIGAGELSSDGKVYTEDAELSVGAGEISMDFLQARKLNATCGMGSLELKMDGEET